MERSRDTSFNQQEDELLCHYGISQDPITSNNQALETLWDKITKKLQCKRTRKLGS